MKNKKFKLHENETLERFLVALRRADVWMEINGMDHNPLYILANVEDPEMEVIPYGLCEMLEQKGGVRFWVGEEIGVKEYIRAEEVYKRLLNQNRKRKVEKRRVHLTLVK